ncbi:hypothetical protein LCGC14_1857080 [marine sediment metagenome]|uniref:Uncharacterized protein n=1 Tax=marine sediment metagenome TaxID=412755 RepID=A0A0F9GWZ0_9ZZZZ
MFKTFSNNQIIQIIYGEIKIIEFKFNSRIKSKNISILKKFIKGAIKRKVYILI